MTTPKYGIIELEAAQSQPEIVVNEGIRVLEAMSQLRVLDKDLAAPPASPSDGDTYLIPSGASGAWSSFPFYITVAIGGSWVYMPPRIGYLAYVTDEDLYYQYSAGSPSGWTQVDFAGTGGGLAGVDIFGIGSPGISVPQATGIRFDGTCEVTDSGGGVATVTVFGGNSQAYAPTLTDATTARVLALSDAGSYIRMTNGSANTVTVPPESSVAWAADTEISVRQAGAGTTTIVAGAGVTVNASSLVSAGQHATLTLKKVGVDTWDLMGATA